MSSHFYVISYINQNCHNYPNFQDVCMTYEEAQTIVRQILAQSIKTHILLENDELSKFLSSDETDADCYDIEQICSHSLEYIIRVVYDHMFYQRCQMYVMHTSGDFIGWLTEKKLFIQQMIIHAHEDETYLDNLIADYVKMIPLQTDLSLQSIGYYNKEKIVFYVNPHSTPFINCGTSPYCLILFKIPMRHQKAQEI